jgi:Rod binding domain-containing protein
MIGDALSQAATTATIAGGARQKFADLKKATDGMQTVFVKSLVAELQKEAQKEFQGMPGSEIYTDMENEAIAQKLTASAHLGLSETLYKPMATMAYQQELAAASRKGALSSKH